MLVRSGFRASCTQSRAPYRAHNASLPLCSLKIQPFATATNTTPGAPQGTEDIHQKFAAYRELLAKRESKNHEMTAKVGPPVDSTEEAELAQNWYWLAISSRNLAAVEQDIKKIQDYMAQNKDFGTFVQRGSLPLHFVEVQSEKVPQGGRVVPTPPAAVSKGEKGPTIAAVTPSKTPQNLVEDLIAAVKPTDPTSKTLQTLASKNKLTSLPKLLKYFQKQSTLASAKSGVTGPSSRVEATLTVAEPWNDNQVDTLLKDFFAKNPGFSSTNVNLTVKVDPSIIGGFKLKIGDRFVDRSERAEFEKGKKAQEQALASFRQRSEEAGLFASEQFWPGPYANNSEFLEAMEDKYSSDVIEDIRKLSEPQFEEEVKLGENSKLIKPALEFAQPTEKLRKLTEGFIYFKNLPKITVNDVVEDFKKVRSIPANTARL